MTTETDHGLAQAIAQYESIKAMLARLNHAQKCKPTDHDDCEEWPNMEITEFDFEEYHDIEQAQDAISDDPLSVQVRSDWHDPGDLDDGYNAEFEILLCTGGPACRMRGDLGRDSQPERAYLQYQDWGTSWTEFFTGDMDTLLDYARQFWFGD